MMYGSVLSGALAGHVHGTAAYDLTTTGEAAGWRPYIWTALRVHVRSPDAAPAPSCCPRARYRDLVPCRKTCSHAAFQARLRTGSTVGPSSRARQNRDFALAYFEARATRPKLANFQPGARYGWTWFEPETGRWHRPITLTADASGHLAAPPFPVGGPNATRDVAAKIVAVPPTAR